MTEQTNVKALGLALKIIGAIFVIGIYVCVLIWPSGWSWHTGTSHHLPHYLQMIIGVYATLGIFLIWAALDPLSHLSLIWFTVWSSVVHALIMTAQALANPETQIGHLWGDIPALLLIAALLAVLTRKAETSRA